MGQDITAIDISAARRHNAKHAEANNGRLLAVFPKGFALDATHRPHITVNERFYSLLISAGSMTQSAILATPSDRHELEAFKNNSRPGRRGWRRRNLREADP